MVQAARRKRNKPGFGLVLWCALLLAPFLLEGCAAQLYDDAYNYGYRQRTTEYSKAVQPECVSTVFIEPQIMLPNNARLVIFPLLSSKDAKKIAAHMTDVLKNTLLQQQTFRIVQISDQYFDNLPALMKYSREKQYDLVLFGEIYNIYSGGEYRQSQIAMKTRIIDPKKEITMLYMENCESADPSAYISYYEVRVKPLPATGPEKLATHLIHRVSSIIGEYAGTAIGEEEVAQPAASAEPGKPTSTPDRKVKKTKAAKAKQAPKPESMPGPKPGPKPESMPEPKPESKPAKEEAKPPLKGAP